MDTQTSDLNAVLKVIDFLADPAAYKAKIAELLEATTTAQAAIDQAQVASVALDEKSAKKSAELNEAFAGYQARLDDDREAFKRTAAEKSADLLRRESAVAVAEKANTIEAARLVDLRADLEARISAINRASDPRPILRAVGDK